MTSTRRKKEETMKIYKYFIEKTGVKGKPIWKVFINCISSIFFNYFIFVHFFKMLNQKLKYHLFSLF